MQMQIFWKLKANFECDASNLSWRQWRHLIRISGSEDTHSFGDPPDIWHDTKCTFVFAFTALWLTDIVLNLLYYQTLIDQTTASHYVVVAAPL